MTLTALRFHHRMEVQEVLEALEDHAERMDQMGYHGRAILSRQLLLRGRSVLEHFPENPGH